MKGMLGWCHALLAARYELEHDIRDEPTAEPNVLTVSLADLAHMTSRIATTLHYDMLLLRKDAVWFCFTLAYAIFKELPSRKTITVRRKGQVLICI